VPVFALPPGTLERQRQRLEAVRLRRDEAQTRSALDAVEAACASQTNVVAPVLAAVDADATLGDVGRALRSARGTWDYPLW
jgi:methylmalonyl-CoA mutase N-terminal domain/subunit